MSPAVNATVGGVIGIGVIAFAIFANVSGWLDTPKQHERRLLCETTAMEGSTYGHPLSKANAEAYCEKLMEMDGEAAH